MRTTWKPLSNETKSLTFLLALTFPFLFSGSVYGTDLQDVVKWDFSRVTNMLRSKNKVFRINNLQTQND